MLFFYTEMCAVSVMQSGSRRTGYQTERIRASIFCAASQTERQ